MKWLLGIIVALVVFVAVLLHTNNQLKEKYNTSIENVKAYDAQLSGLEDNNRMFKLTIEQLEYLSDSVTKKLDQSRKELGIKDKNLQQLQYQLAEASRSDTVLVPDTIFRDPSFQLDTIVGDKWFRNTLHLKYPNIIASTPEITIERHTFISGKRETVNPPKKFFLFRWFQKKHTVVEVTTRELNPYVEEKIQKYIQIID